MRRSSIVTTTLLASVALAAPARATTISPKGVRFAQVAVNAAGATIVAWERIVKGVVTVEVRTGDAPAKLGRTRRLASPGHAPRVAVGADGTRAVQWFEDGARGVRLLRVAVARPGHGFGRGQLLDRRRSNVGSEAVAVQPNGRVVAVWRRADGLLGYALAARGHAFGKARDLTTTGPSSTNTLAVDPRDGAVVLSYATPLGRAPISNQQAGARTLAATATAFSAPVVLSDPAGLAEAHSVVVTGSGGTGVTYSRTGDPASLHLVRRNGDGTWAAPQLIAKPVYGDGVFAVDPIATLPTDGSALAAWAIATDPAGLGSISRQTAASIAPPAAPFGLPALLTPPTETYGSSAVASAGAEAFLATAKAHGPVLLATRAAGSATLQTRTVTSSGDGDVALAAGGTHVLLAYQRDDRLRLHTVR